MCGIIGYAGKNGAAADIIVRGLKKLEYRGYDSAGLAVFNEREKRIDCLKKEGKVDVLAGEVKKHKIISYAGIGHTRWATHGKPSDENAHPHGTKSGRFFVVHNGIIENYAKLKEELLRDGVKFASQTDSEVIPNLIEKNYSGDFFAAVRATLPRLKGSYALCIMCADFPGTIIAVKHESPLVVGSYAGGGLIASDMTALADYTDEVYVLENDDMAVVDGKKIEIFSDGILTMRPLTKTGIKAGSVSRGSYDSFMQKEIMEVPLAMQDTIDGITASAGIKKLTPAYLRHLKCVKFIGCGTAYHAGLVGANVLTKLCNISALAEVASEFKYNPGPLDRHTLCIFISQSGETADTLGSVKIASNAGCLTVAITNVTSSTITRIADCVLPTRAGPEIAVASTKAYNAQLAAIYSLCFLIADGLGCVDEGYKKKVYEELFCIGEAAGKVVMKVLPDVAQLAKKYSHSKCVFFIGRALDFCVAREGSLKLKEISYIMSEAYPSGELKHGTLALIEEGVTAVAIITQKHLLDKSLSALAEIKARGGAVILVTTIKDAAATKDADHVILLPQIEDILSPLISVIPLQLFALYCTLERGLTPDRPRNLAKSVTVE